MPSPSDLRPAVLLILALAGLAGQAGALQVDARPVLGAPQDPPDPRPTTRASLPAPVQGATGPAGSRLVPKGEGLAAVRAFFKRVDADSNGRLDRREAYHAGVDAVRLQRSDFDGDGTLDPGEFSVARQRELSRRGLPVGLDLIGESTRIQALWRARASQAQRAGAPAVLRSSKASAQAGTRPGVRSASPSGPGQARLTAALDSSAALTAERARRAQILLELRRRRRGPR